MSDTRSKFYGYKMAWYNSLSDNGRLGTKISLALVAVWIAWGIIAGFGFGLTAWLVSSLLAMLPLSLVFATIFICLSDAEDYERKRR